MASFLAFRDENLFRKLSLDPYLAQKNNEYYRVITHAFIHGNWFHLFVNAFVLFQFGGVVEDDFNYLFGAKGSLYFVVVYLGGIIAASLPALKKHGDNPYYTAVGASGAVAAVLFSFILMRPTAMLGVFLVIPMPAFVVGILYLWYEKRMTDSNDRIAHDAHYWGAIFGVVATAIFKPSLALEFVQKIQFAVQSWF